MNFTELIGQEVSLLVPRMHKEELQQVTVVGVDGGGIWIESQEMMNVTLRRLNAKTAAYNLAFFLPFHEIAFGLTRGSGQALDEKSFGL